MHGSIQELNMSEPLPLTSENAEGSVAEKLPATPASPRQQAWFRFKRNRLALAGVWFLIAVAAFVIIFPLCSHYKPDALSEAQLQPPSGDHLLGTDAHGRDLLVRLCYGAKISFMVGIVGATVSLVIGVLWGAVAGYAGGRTDGAMMRFVDVLYSMPTIIFAMVLMSAVEPSLRDWFSKLGFQDPSKAARVALLFFALGAVSWLTMARIVRGQVLSLRTRAFVDASRVLGASPLHILGRHIIPNVLGIVIVYLALTVPGIILYESFLSFLGLGIQPPMASWGSLIAEGAGQINPIQIYWWLLVFPAGLMVLTLLALNFLGDGLRDAWDVKG